LRIAGQGSEAKGPCNEEMSDKMGASMTMHEIEILLIDDSPEDVALALHVLRREKLANRIQVLRLGEEALDFVFCRGEFANRCPDQFPQLVLLDLNLPQMNGTEVLKQIKSDPRTRPIPVVVLTSSKEERDLVSCYELGANSYIQKPVEFEEFRNAVRQLGRYWLIANQPPVRTGMAQFKGAGVR
jgi:two-component system, response regulator